MPSFQVNARSTGERCVLDVAGEVDLASAPALVDAGTAGLADVEIKTLVVDLGEVTFMDSTALGALVSLRNTAIEQGKTLSLARVPERVQQLLTITALADVFDIDAA